MKTIFRYDIPLGIMASAGVIELGEFVIDAPKFSKIIHVGTNPQEIPSIWMEVNTDYPKEQMHLHIVCTGTNLSDGLVYVGSFVKDWFVGHIYTEEFHGPEHSA